MPEEESGEGATDALEKYEVYRQMLADWFNEPPEQAINKVEAFEKAVKKQFIEEPGQMKLLIVVEKLLTGFDDYVPPTAVSVPRPKSTYPKSRRR